MTFRRDLVHIESEPLQASADQLRALLVMIARRIDRGDVDQVSLANRSISGTRLIDGVVAARIMTAWS